MWAYLPSACFPASEDSTSLRNRKESKLSATSNGTVTLRASSCPESATDDSTTPPYGQTSRLSMQKRGVEKWISSLEDSPVNHIAQLANGGGQRINEIYGPTQCEYCASLERGDLSGKTSQESLPMDLPHKSWQTLNERISAGLSFQIQPVPLVRHTCVAGCSLYPTPIASDGVSWTKVKKADVQTSIHKATVLNGSSVRVTYFSMWAMRSPIQAAEFAEWMMGYGRGWTDLDAAATEWFQAKPLPPLEN